MRRFDPNNIPEECFGGEEPLKAVSSQSQRCSPLEPHLAGGLQVVPGVGASNVKELSEKLRNAYLLFYDRVKVDEKDDDDSKGADKDDEEWEKSDAKEPAAGAMAGDSKSAGPSPSASPSEFCCHACRLA